MTFINVLAIVLTCVTLVLAVVINILILLQKKRATGLGGSLTGMGVSSGTYWDKNRGRSLEGKLERWTKIVGAAFMVICLILNVIH